MVQVKCQKPRRFHNHYYSYRDCSIFIRPVKSLRTRFNLPRTIFVEPSGGGSTVANSLLGFALMTMILHRIADDCNGNKVPNREVTSDPE